MTPAAGKIALLYDDDGYKEVLGQPLKDANATRTGLIGRQVAGKEFLDAYLSHGSWTELVALVRNQASAQSILRLCESHPSSQTRRRGLRVIEERRFHQAFFPTPPANLLYNPCPPDLRYAWARQHKGPGSFALSGVTHTLCSQRALEWLGDLVTAPFESYDSLICTSQAVVDMVRAVTTSYADYLRDRHGGNPRARIRLEKIPLGVNTELFRPPTTQERAAQRRAFRIEADEVAVLFVGRLSHHGKAHPFPMYHGLAQAARRAGRKVHLILSGWAPNQAVQKAFEDGARTFAAGIRVSFLDGTDPAQRYAVWQAADLFTSLSDNIQETFGLVIVEAMASGLPVVASDWNDDQIGLHVRPGPQRFVDCVAVPDGILGSPAAIMRLLGRSTLQMVLDFLDAVGMAGRLLRDERAADAVILDQITGDVAELGRVILMNEQDVHGRQDS